MCTWCDKWGYWECDGEGGDCQGSPGGDGCIGTHPGLWLINCTKPLQYTNGKEVHAPGNPHEVVMAHIFGIVTPNGPMVILNGKAVPVDDDDQPPLPPKYKDGRTEPTWDINIPFEMPWPPLTHREDDPGTGVTVRVQAYTYDGKPPYNPKPHPQGVGLKIRVIGGEDPNA